MTESHAPRQDEESRTPPQTRSSLVVVSNRLPVEGSRDEAGEWHWERSPGGLVTALEPVVERSGGVWIGSLGIADESMEPFETTGTTLGRPFTVVPITLSEDETQRYYEGFSNASLWPLYHEVIAPPRYHRDWWESYRTVNRRFAQAVADSAEPGARVWVQDYQLQLVPRMVRELRPDVSIGFFNHIPFPPPGIYSQLPWRRQILEGLLGADLVGFQRAEDARNFAQTVRRLLGYTVHHGIIETPAGAEFGGEAGDSGSPDTSDRGAETTRPVSFGAFPISIDVASFAELGRDPRVRARAREIRRELGNPKTVLLGVDRLDYTKGIRHRIKAHGELLAEHRIDVEDTVMVEIAVPSRERVQTYQDLRDDIELAVSRINGDFSTVGHTAINYLHRSLPRRELAAFYLASDVLLINALRDGMNLVCKEYVATRVDNDGVLILSEFAGAADELRQALLINPHDIDGVKAQTLRAIRMPERERRSRMRSLRRTVARNDLQRWTRDFLDRLDEAATNAHLAAGSANRSGARIAGGAHEGGPTVPESAPSGDAPGEEHSTPAGSAHGA